MIAVVREEEDECVSTNSTSFAVDRITSLFINYITKNMFSLYIPTLDHCPAFFLTLLKIHRLDLISSPIDHPPVHVISS